MNAETLRQQLVQLSNLQAALDAMRTSLILQLKEAQTPNDRQLRSL